MCNFRQAIYIFFIINFWGGGGGGGGGWCGIPPIVTIATPDQDWRPGWIEILQLISSTSYLC